MADDVVEEFIAGVATELAANRVIFTNKVGDLTFDENDSAPLISWAWGPVIHGVTNKVGGTEPAIYTEDQRMLVRVWGETRAATRLLKNQLVSVLRKRGTGHAIRLEETWEWVADAHEHSGYALEGEVGILIEVTDPFPSTLRLIETQTHDVTHENPATEIQTPVC